MIFIAFYLHSNESQAHKCPTDTAVNMLSSPVRVTQCYLEQSALPRPTLLYLSSLELMLTNDPHNLSRLAFLSAFDRKPWESITGADEDALVQLAQEAHTWATSQIPEVLNTLKMPKMTECAGLMAVAHRHGGLAFLKDRCVTRPRPHMLTCRQTEIIMQDAPTAAQSGGRAFSASFC